MGEIVMSGLGEEELKIIKQEADEAGMTDAGFCRTRFRAGFRLWRAGGDFDTLEMQRRLNQPDQKPSVEQERGPVEPASGAEHDRFVEKVRENLPTNESDAVSIDELKSIVAEEVVVDVIDELREEGRVHYVTGSGYIKQEER